MFFRYRRLLYGLACALMAAGCVLVQVRRQQRLHEQQARPFGRFTQTQIASRARPLFQLLVPDKEGWMAITSLTGNRPDGSIQRFWTAECMKSNSPIAANLVYFQWDADTGDLVTASYLGSEWGVESDHSPLTARQAVERSWQYLCSLGFAKAGSRWQCDREPRLGEVSWSLHWHSREENVTMHLGAASGRFLSAATRVLLRFQKARIGNAAACAISAIRPEPTIATYAAIPGERGRSSAF